MSGSNKRVVRAAPFYWVRSLSLTHREQGISLVIVLILLGSMALGSVAALRSSGGSLQVGRAWLMQALAQEQAQAGLRYCEAQLQLPNASRDPRLADQALTWSNQAQMAWNEAAVWQSGTQVVTAVLPASMAATKPPVCLVEKQVLMNQPDDLPIYVVTARGFSPDHRADASSGATTAGVALWLQSTVLIEDGQVRARGFKRIINPPLR